MSISRRSFAAAVAALFAAGGTKVVASVPAAPPAPPTPRCPALHRVAMPLGVTPDRLTPQDVAEWETYLNAEQVAAIRRRSADEIAKIYNVPPELVRGVPSASRSLDDEMNAAFKADLQGRQWVMDGPYRTYASRFYVSSTNLTIQASYKMPGNSPLSTIPAFDRSALMHRLKVEAVARWPESRGGWSVRDEYVHEGGVRMFRLTADRSREEYVHHENDDDEVYQNVRRPFDVCSMVTFVPKTGKAGDCPDDVAGRLLAEVRKSAEIMWGYGCHVEVTASAFDAGRGRTIATITGVRK